MNKAKALSLLLLIVAGTGLVFASFGFTSVSVERGLSVQVVNDERAYVGYQSSDLTVRDGETAGLVTVKNRLTHTIDIVDVTIEGRSLTIRNLTTPTNISPGEGKAIRGTVECTPNVTQEAELTVTLRGSGVDMRIFGDSETREFSLTCEPEKNSTSSRTHIQSEMGV